MCVTQQGLSLATRRTEKGPGRVCREAVASIFTAAFLVTSTACVAPESRTVGTVADSAASELLTPPPAVAGLVIAVGRSDRILLDRAYGKASAESGELLEPSDAHRIGSLTKQFTAAAILQLVEQGKIRLDAPVQEYLPDFDTQGYHVTVRNLLNHTSGIRSYTALYAGTGRQPVPRDEVLDTLQLHPFDFRPGDRYRYSNSGYYLLGVIIEVVSGDSPAQYLHGHLFEPLGLERTSYCGFDGEAVPYGYRAPADTLEMVVLRDTDYLGGSGGLCSTARDLANWQHALATGRVVSPSSYEIMTTPTVLSNGDTVPHGLGTDLSTLEGHPVVEQGGSVAGFSARMAYYPDVGLSVAVLVNTETPKAGAVQGAVARAGLGLARLVPTDLALSAEMRAQYAGMYDAGPIQLRVYEDGERLLLQPSGQSTARLLFQGENVFLADIGREARIEFAMEGGRATALTLHQGSQQLEALRIEQ